MNLDIEHKHIKPNLIRTFAHACELLDRYDSPDKAGDGKLLELLNELVNGNADMLSRVSDYRIADAAVATEQEPGVERIFSVNQTQTIHDPATLRRDLREQLYQCLLFLELAENEGRRCMLSFHDVPDAEIDVCLVIQEMLNRMHAGLRHLNALSPGIAS